MERFPEKSRFWLLRYAILPFENVLDIDEYGDDWFDKPRIYTTEFGVEREPFCGFKWVLARNSRLRGPSIVDSMITGMDDEPLPDEKKRVLKFPRRKG